MKVVESFFSLSLRPNLPFPFLAPAQGRQEYFSNLTCAKVIGLLPCSWVYKQQVNATLD